MITVKELIEQLQKENQEAYIAIEARSCDADNWLAHRGVSDKLLCVGLDEMVDGDDFNNPNYDEKRPWIVIG